MKYAIILAAALAATPALAQQANEVAALDLAIKQADAVCGPNMMWTETLRPTDQARESEIRTCRTTIVDSVLDYLKKGASK